SRSLVRCGRPIAGTGSAPATSHVSIRWWERIERLERGSVPLEAHGCFPGTGATQRIVGAVQRVLESDRRVIGLANESDVGGGVGGVGAEVAIADEEEGSLPMPVGGGVRRSDQDSKCGGGVVAGRISCVAHRSHHLLSRCE